MIMTTTPPHTSSMFKTSGLYFEKEGGHCSLYKRLNICYPCTPYIVASIKDSIFVVPTHVLYKRLNICCPYPCTPYIVASIKD